jgi:hypothetical protein
VPAEFLEAAARQDASLETSSAEFRVLRAFCAAGQRDGAAARADLTAAAAIDESATRAFAARAAVLPGLSGVMKSAGIRLDEQGFHEDGPP